MFSVSALTIIRNYGLSLFLLSISVLKNQFLRTCVRTAKLSKEILDNLKEKKKKRTDPRD